PDYSRSSPSLQPQVPSPFPARLCPLARSSSSPQPPAPSPFPACLLARSYSSPQPPAPSPFRARSSSSLQPQVSPLPPPTWSNSFLVSLPMRGEQLFERFQIDLAVGVQEPRGALELAGDRFVVEDFDPRDQPVEPQADGRVGDVVFGGQLLERAGSEHEPL